MGDQCTLSGTVIGGDGQPLPGVAVTFSLKHTGHLYYPDNRLVDRTPIKLLTDGSGVASSLVDRNDKLRPFVSRWLVEVPEAGLSKQILVNEDAMDFVAAPDAPI